jgi:hypothetical protein
MLKIKLSVIILIHRKVLISWSENFQRVPILYILLRVQKMRLLIVTPTEIRTMYVISYAETLYAMQDAKYSLN